MRVGDLPAAVRGAVPGAELGALLPPPGVQTERISPARDPLQSTLLGYWGHVTECQLVGAKRPCARVWPDWLLRAHYGRSGAGIGSPKSDKESRLVLAWEAWEGHEGSGHGWLGWRFYPEGWSGGGVELAKSGERR
jgi:hypothetical protein